MEINLEKVLSLFPLENIYMLLIELKRHTHHMF
nr:MAG TPA: hypothetical protein [Caudoviricetes sp.]DAK75838.1 MAG TPA: hypothetical protein [Caudoviricetes sp.]